MTLKRTKLLKQPNICEGYFFSTEKLLTVMYQKHSIKCFKLEVLETQQMVEVRCVRRYIQMTVYLKISTLSHMKLLNRIMILHC